MSRVEPERNRYVGHRYVPKIFGEWDQQNEYEGLSIVTHQGNSYTSKKRVPVGIDILNDEFWVVTGNYNAQVEQYRQDVRNVENYVDDEILRTTNYVDDEISKTTNYVNDEIANSKQYVDDSVADLSQRTEVIEDKFINESITMSVPSEYSTLSLAMDKASEYISKINTTIEIVLESNYRIDRLKLVDGDYSKIVIKSIDDIVMVSDNHKTADLFYFENCTAPTLDILVDAMGVSGRGIYAVNSNVTLTEGSGVMNCDSDNIYATNGSNVTASRTIFTGGGRNSEHGASISCWNGSNIIANGADASNSINYGVRASQGGYINFDDGICNNSGRHGIRASQGSRVSCLRASSLNSGMHGLYALNSSQINARDIDVSGSQNTGILADSSSQITATQGIANNCGTAVKALSGSVIDFFSGTANDCISSVIEATHSATVEARNLIANIGTPVSGLVANEGSRISASSSKIRGVQLTSIVARNGSNINASPCEIRDCNVGVLSERGSYINVTSGTVWGTTHNSLRVDTGGVINADGCTTKSNIVFGGDNIKAPHIDDVNVNNFNELTGFGYITN